MNYDVGYGCTGSYVIVSMIWGLTVLRVIDEMWVYLRVLSWDEQLVEANDDLIL